MFNPAAKPRRPGEMDASKGTVRDYLIVEVHMAEIDARRIVEGFAGRYQGSTAAELGDRLLAMHGFPNGSKNGGSDGSKKGC